MIEDGRADKSSVADAQHNESGFGAVKQAVSRSAQMDRVIDVPLAVTLRFGERQMRLRDVLELNTGSLVELDRQVEEPVDLMLGERVIARGEVIILDGNYGLRVQEVVERVSAGNAVAGSAATPAAPLVP